MNTNARKKPAPLALAQVPNEDDYTFEEVRLSVAEIRREMAALNAALVSVEYNREHEKVLPLVLDVIPIRSNPTTAEDVSILSAMMTIAGHEVPSMPIDLGPAWSERVLILGATAWIAWSEGDLDRASKTIALFRDEQRAKEGEVTDQPGAMNLFCLYYLLAAVEKLTTGDIEEARRRWKRALDVGSQFGTDSHLAVSWLYAATFLKRKSVTATVPTVLH